MTWPISAVLIGEPSVHCPRPPHADQTRWRGKLATHRRWKWGRPSTVISTCRVTLNARFRAGDLPAALAARSSAPASDSDRPDARASRRGPGCARRRWPSPSCSIPARSRGRVGSCCSLRSSIRFDPASGRASPATAAVPPRARPRCETATARNRAPATARLAPERPGGSTAMAAPHRGAAGCVASAGEGQAFGKSAFETESRRR